MSKAEKSSPYQLSFESLKPVDQNYPLTDPSPQKSKRRKEIQRKFRTLPKGTLLHTGAIGQMYTQENIAQQELLVVELYERIVDGIRSVRVEVESPPELKGYKYWVAQKTLNQKNNGYR